MGLHFLAFWHFFPFILALWAFISLQFGNFGLLAANLWGPPLKLPKTVRLPKVSYKEFRSARFGFIFQFLAFISFHLAFLALISFHFGAIHLARALPGVTLAIFASPIFPPHDGSPGHGRPGTCLPGARDGQPLPTTKVGRCCRGVPRPGPRLAQGGVVWSDPRRLTPFSLEHLASSETTRFAYQELYNLQPPCFPMHVWGRFDGMFFLDTLESTHMGLHTSIAVQAPCRQRQACQLLGSNRTQHVFKILSQHVFKILWQLWSRPDATQVLSTRRQTVFAFPGPVS